MSLSLSNIWWSIFIVSGILIFLIFYGYSLIIVILSLFHRSRIERSTEWQPTVTLLVVARNGEGLLEKKITNCKSLIYPEDKLKMIFCSDGSSDGSADILQESQDGRLKAMISDEHIGKNALLRLAIDKCRDEVIVFTDVDALLEAHAIQTIVEYFSDPTVGGVCGRRTIYEQGNPLGGAQGRYIEFDCSIKHLESRVGSLTSNDGKIYAIRRSLSSPIPDGVTDDLYNCLSVIAQGFRFVFSSSTVACIKLPSRSPIHEVRRRRRIVARSLYGIYLHRQLLNPFRHGQVALGLLINKVIRRLLLLLLVCLYISNLGLAIEVEWMGHPLILQSGFYTMAGAYFLIKQNGPTQKIASIAFYFCLGSYAALMGCLDFLIGKKVVKWEPLKAD